VTNPDGNRDSAIERMLRDTLEARSAPAPQGHCLDADTLAAWADNGLRPAERSAVEAHAADCARCQMLLAAMTRTTPSPAEPSPSWWRVHRFRWVVPLAGVGAAVILWTLMPIRPNVQLTPAIPLIDDVAEAPVAAGSRPGSGSELDKRVERPEVEGRLRAPADESPSTSSEAKAARQETSATGERAPSARFAPQAPAPAAAGSAAEPAASSVMAAPEMLSARTRASAGDSLIVSASNPGSRWRIVPGGAVQRSSDAGSTWQTQQTGVDVTLIAGASPSPSVCWLVGPAGIVLLSTDGLSWRRLAFPEATDLIAIQATDDKTAIVASADGRSFSTDDGGVTWKTSPAQDFPAAPF
jgi:hypothetical protein